MTQMEDQHIPIGLVEHLLYFDSQRTLVCTFLVLNDLNLTAVESSPIGVYGGEIHYTKFVLKSDGKRTYSHPSEAGGGGPIKEKATAPLKVTLDEAREQPLRWRQSAGKLLAREDWDESKRQEV